MTSNTTAANFLGLPDILPDIYRASDPLDAVKKHIETLEKEISVNPNNINSKLLKNALEQYYYCVSQLGEEHNKLFQSLHDNTVANHPKLYIKTIARTKSVLRFYNKCRRKLLTENVPSETNDIYACRITIDDASLAPQEVIKLCYQIAHESIIFMISQGYNPCTTTGVKDTEDGFQTEQFPTVILPQEDYSKKCSYQNVIKDYIAHPKTLTGYQSLHIVFSGTDGRKFELQIRTALMHHHAEEYDSANHDFYEEMQDKKVSLPPLNIDRNKIKMSFYVYMYGKLTDDSGLEKSSPCMQDTHYGKRNAAK